MSSFHTAVLLDEVLYYLNPQPNQNFIDATVGGGGHAIEMAKRIQPNGKLLGIDKDDDALKEVNIKFKNENTKLLENIILVKGNFQNIKEICEKEHFINIQGILFDLGVSSYQLDEPKKGFGFESNTLDMRMDTRQKLNAQDIINTWDEKRLTYIFQTFGEERKAKLIARKVVQQRRRKKITSPKELIYIVTSIYKKFYRKPSRLNPATKVFQALRIAVNHETENLAAGLEGAIEILQTQGRLAVISYHSIEDKIIKKIFSRESKNCICPPLVPLCQCHHIASIKKIFPKLVVPTHAEIARNHRSRSAKLRVVEKL